MTSIVSLANRLRKRIEWQETQETVHREDLCDFIAEAIRFLYVNIGKGDQEIESKFETDEYDMYVSFADDLANDEQMYVLYTAEMDFYKKVQSETSTMTSYTTDALAVTHGDKPFEHLGEKIAKAEEQRNLVWWRMLRYNLL